MTSFLGVYDRNGKHIAHCCARCYNAKPPSERHMHHGSPGVICECICGGKNHAMGEAKALKNYLAGIGQRPEDLKTFAERRKLRACDLVVIDRLKHSRWRAKQLAKKKFKRHKLLPLFKFASLAGKRKPAESARQRRG